MNNTSSELDEFRQQWKQEVQRKSVPLPADSPFATPPSSPPLKPNKQDQVDGQLSAIDNYVMAMDMERMGQLGQALLHYRQAFKLDPDVDRAYRKLNLAEPSASANTRQCDPLVAIATADGSDIRTLLGHSHYEQTSNTVAAGDGDPLDALVREFLHQDISYIPRLDYKPLAIAKLPDELLVHVLGHLVLHSVSSVAAFALVCKRFFLATRSASLWRHACEHMFRTPGMTLEQSRQHQAVFVNSMYDGYWFRMFIERPRLRFDGVYISVCQYTRPGISDNSWIHPVQLVTYYRYLRFFPDGTMIKYLSTDQPADVVRLLTSDFSRRQVFHGRFRIEDSGEVWVEMRDQTRPRDRFQMALCIKSTSRGRHNKMGWTSYVSQKDGREEVTTYDLNSMRPYFFSVVRHYRNAL
ncbi:hypothetical protein BJV82DRAFT_600692 [Fennellomyces sp. T-0311]|nr:hypothetical protein BJV82DRAFT_600692 [Fennellomyces sp. T-0311]